MTVTDQRPAGRILDEAAIERIVAGYINSAPSYDQASGCHVSRQYRLHRSEPGVINLGCRVRHLADLEGTGSYNGTWTRGLLMELAAELRRHGYVVSDVMVGVLLNVDVSLG